MFWYILILLIVLIGLLFLKKVGTQGMENNYLDGIDVVYWINLDRSQERRENMEKMFKDGFHIPNNRISAIDGKNEVLVYNQFKTNKYNITTKEYACTLSHLNAIKNFNESTYDIALILEDDCTLELKKYWKKSVKQIMNEAPEDWEIIMLNYIILPGNDHPFLTWKNDSDYTDILPSSCLSYIINKKGSNKIINIEDNKHVLSDDIHHVADAYIYLSAKTYCYKYPMFIYPKDNDSEISDGHLNINEYARNLIIQNYENYVNSSK